MVMFKNLSYLPLNLLQNKREEKWGKGAWATPNTSAHKAPSHPATRYSWCVTDSQIRDGEISSDSSSTSQNWKLELQKGQNSSWSPKARNLPALAAAQLEWRGQRCCGETIDLSVIQVWDFVLTPCVWSVNLQLFPKLSSLEQPGLIGKMNASYLEEHFLMIRLQKQNTPAGRRVRANPCCAATLQRELILLQFQTASQSFNILIHSML